MEDKTTLEATVQELKDAYMKERCLFESQFDQVKHKNFELMEANEKIEKLVQDLKASHFDDRNQLDLAKNEIFELKVLILSFLQKNTSNYSINYSEKNRIT